MFRAQTNNWILLVYFSLGFIDVDRRSIGGCRVRLFLGSVENLLLFLQLFGFSLSFLLLIFPDRSDRPMLSLAPAQPSVRMESLSGAVILCYFTDILQVHNNMSRNVTVIIHRLSNCDCFSHFTLPIPITYLNLQA